MRSRDLTPAEERVLRLAATGMTNDEIAASLVLSRQTVKFHLTRVYRKLGISNRTQASVWAHEHGLMGSAS